MKTIACQFVLIGHHTSELVVACVKPLIFGTYLFPSLPDSEQLPGPRGGRGGRRWCRVWAVGGSTLMWCVWDPTRTCFVAALRRGRHAPSFLTGALDCVADVMLLLV